MTARSSYPLLSLVGLAGSQYNARGKWAVLLKEPCKTDKSFSSKVIAGEHLKALIST
jgi:hypothetical protein